MGVQLGIMGVQLGGKGHLGRFARLRLRCGNCRASAGGCHRASLMIKRSEAAAAVRPGPAAPFRLTVLVVSAVHKPGPVGRAGAAASLCLPNAGRLALAVLAWSGDRSPIRGCTTSVGVQVPPRTLFRILSIMSPVVLSYWAGSGKSPVPAKARRSPASHGHRGTSPPSCPAPTSGAAHLLWRLTQRRG